MFFWRTTIKPLVAKLLGRATQLTRAGKLLEATTAIQRALGGKSSARAPADDRPTIDADFRVVDASMGSYARTKSDGSHRAVAGFTSGTYATTAGSRQYKLFMPSGFAAQQLPLVVMLHGCKQDPDDFAAGTRMNELAQERGVMVLYPAQAPRSNAYKCWNWFQPGDQHRGSGEPALLAGLTEHIIATQSVDAGRVYIAGLSAGGAMAAIMGREYPDLFAAVGVHSGLAPGSARDVGSAFAAMKNGAAGTATRVTAASVASRGAPIIVFHGDSDDTVHASNGVHVVGDRRGASARDHKADASGRRYSRRVFKATERHAEAEHWIIEGAGHAWSGGSTEGSYTDPQGPDASREMLRFFLEHRRDQRTRAAA